MNNTIVKRNAALLMRWALLIGLAVTVRCEGQCEFSNHTSDATTIDMNGCWLTSVNTTALEGFPKLQNLVLYANSLTTFPDLSPVAATLRSLNLATNRITSISATDLDGLTSLEALKLGSNDLTNFPDLAPVAGTLKRLVLRSNNISVLSNDDLSSLINLESLLLQDNIHLAHFPHTVNVFSSMTNLFISGTSISHLPPILFNDVAKVQNLDVSNSVDLCKCENAWLKQEGPKIAGFQYDDADCGGQNMTMQWSNMTMDDFDKKCEGERALKEKNFALANYVKSNITLKAFLLHSHEAGISKIECTTKCLNITGCVSFYWRRLQDMLGDCVIIAPGNTINVGSVPDGSLEVWTYFAVQQN